MSISQDRHAYAPHETFPFAIRPSGGGCGMLECNYIKESFNEKQASRHPLIFFIFFSQHRHYITLHYIIIDLKEILRSTDKSHKMDASSVSKLLTQVDTQVKTVLHCAARVD